MTDKKAKKRSAWDRIMTAFKAHDEEAITEAIAEAKEEAEEEGTTQRVVVEVTPSGQVEAEHTGEASDKAMSARMDKLEKTVDSLAKTVTDSLARFAKDSTETGYSGGNPDVEQSSAASAAVEPAYASGAKSALDEADKDDDEDDDDERKKKDKKSDDRKSRAKDSFDVTDWRDTIAKAEILCPGIRLPTRDSAMTAEKAKDALCTFRRTALTKAYATDEGKVAIEHFLTKGRSVGFDKMNCDAAKAVFDGASALMAHTNDSRKQAADADDMFAAGGGAYDPSARNKRNRDFWAARGS